jgi:hypothetical protein
MFYDVWGIELPIQLTLYASFSIWLRFRGNVLAKLVQNSIHEVNRTPKLAISLFSVARLVLTGSFRTTTRNVQINLHIGQLPYTFAGY